jgi:hypothetical protein
MFQQSELKYPARNITLKPGYEFHGTMPTPCKTSTTSTAFLINHLYLAFSRISSFFQNVFNSSEVG